MEQITIRVKTKKKARLQAKLTIIPIEAVEDLELDIILTDSLLLFLPTINTGSESGVSLAKLTNMVSDNLGILI